MNLLFCEKCEEKTQTKFYHVYKTMVVLHICNRILGIPSQEYPGNKKTNIDAYQSLSSIYDV